eukprot:TRINITY_DN8954_c0_g2_i1.p1 TRINITY_DN8954_c0_g2~~TRINITY_DN8954_c0_g2_i1.p1  ORF type:complete len:113 (-),score=29.21 TRINITY_DN8954_c0_g2_i1:43-381(-)
MSLDGSSGINAEYGVGFGKSCELVYLGKTGKNLCNIGLDQCQGSTVQIQGLCEKEKALNYYPQLNYLKYCHDKLYLCEIHSKFLISGLYCGGCWWLWQLCRLQLYLLLMQPG